MRHLALFFALLLGSDIALARALTDANLAINQITDTEVSPPIRVENSTSYSIQAIIDVNTPAAVTFDTGTMEVQTLTFESLADTDHQDLVIISSQSALTFAIALTKPVASVDTVNLPDVSALGNGDYFVVYDAAGLSWAAALTKPRVDIDTLNFDTTAASADGDYVVITDTAGLTWAVALDKDGIPAGAPTGAIWTAIPAGRKSNCDISAAVEDEDVAAAVELCIDALTGFSAVVATDDTANDGTMTFTSVAKALVAVAVPHNTGDTGAGSIAVTATQAGIASQTPTGAAYTAVNAARKVVVDVGGVATDEDAAALVVTAIEALTGFTTAFTTVDNADGTITITRDTKAPTTAPVVMAFDDGGAGAITATNGTAGVADTAPAGALYTAVASARKSTCDISATTTAAQVAAAAELCLDALTGLTALITTDDGAANGTMLLTQIVPGATTNPVPKNADESGAGGIGGVQTTAGVATEVSPSADTFTIPSHGFYEGVKIRLTTTGTLPTGVTTGVDYFVIVVDTDTIQLAASLAAAQAGTEIDITDYGVTASVNTVTATALAGATVKVEKSNSTQAAVDAGTGVWEDVASATAITADAEVWFEKDKPPYKWIRLSYTLTAGMMSTVNNIIVK